MYLIREVQRQVSSTLVHRPLLDPLRGLALDAGHAATPQELAPLRRPARPRDAGGAAVSLGRGAVSAGDGLLAPGKGLLAPGGRLLAPGGGR